MKRFTLLVALCIVFWGFTICTSQEAFALGTLQGFVTDAATGDPIEGATVEIRVVDTDTVIASATTDSFGFYFADIEAGLYDVTTSAAGYQTGTAEDLEVLEADITNQDFALKLNLLQGYVTDGTDPIEGATVEIRVVDTDTVIAWATTDSLGFYSFADIEAGLYDVTASKECYSPEFAYDVEVIEGVTTTLPDFVLTEDTTAPELQVSVSPNKLWPPNHKYRMVTATVEVSDDLDSDPTVTLVSVTSNEPDNARGRGDGNTINDIVIVDDYTFKFRAERSGKGTGRIYTITYEAVDSCGNSSLATATVTVPKNRKKVK